MPFQSDAVDPAAFETKARYCAVSAYNGALRVMVTGDCTTGLQTLAEAEGVAGSAWFAAYGIGGTIGTGGSGAALSLPGTSVGLRTRFRPE